MSMLISDHLLKLIDANNELIKHNIGFIGTPDAIIAHDVLVKNFQQSMLDFNSSLQETIQNSVNKALQRFKDDLK